MKAIAFIPARGGSKGVPRKNILPLCGKPLVVHSIEYALSAPAIDNVYVSTDDDEIAGIAHGAGAAVIRRPAELATDTATTESACAHLLQALDNDRPDIIVLLQPTSPLRPAGSLSQALAVFINDNCDSLLSISPTHRFFWRIENGTVLAEYDFQNRPRRQDMRPGDIRYVENGSLYIFTRAHFEKTGNRLGGKIGHIIFPEEYSHEIDTLADFQFIEYLGNTLQKQAGK